MPSNTELDVEIEEILFFQSEPMSSNMLADWQIAQAKSQIKQLLIKARIEGRITGLRSANRYKGNGFEVSWKINKEIHRLTKLKKQLEGDL